MSVTIEELLLKIDVQGAAKAVNDINSVTKAWVNLLFVMNQPMPTPKFPNFAGFKMPSFGGGGGGGLGGFAMMLAPQAALASAAIAAIGVAAHEAVNAFKDAANYAREVLTIRELTGGTTKEAAGFANMFRVAGVNDSQAIRLFTHSIEAVRTPRGVNAFQRAGIHVNLNDSGTTTLAKLIPALNAMPDGIRKTNIELDIFGARLAGSAAALENLTAFQIMQAGKNAEMTDPRDYTAVTRAMASINLLGNTIMTQFIMPIAGRLAPIIERFADTFSALLTSPVMQDAINSAAIGLQNLAYLVSGVVAGLLLFESGLFIAYENVAKVINAFIDWAQQFLDKLNIHLPKLEDIKPPADDANIKRIADSVDAIKVRVVGGGERARGAASQIEAEILWHNANRLGAG